MMYSLLGNKPSGRVYLYIANFIVGTCYFPGVLSRLVQVIWYQNWVPTLKKNLDSSKTKVNFTIQSRDINFLKETLYEKMLQNKVIIDYFTISKTALKTIIALIISEILIFSHLLNIYQSISQDSQELF